MPDDVNGSEQRAPSAPVEVFGVLRDPEVDERLRTDLIAITEAERKALNDAGHLIAAENAAFPGAQRLASAVLSVANRGGVPAPGQHHEGIWRVNPENGECGCECPRCYRQDECACPDCRAAHHWHGSIGIQT